jgi:hypothetical protein
MPTAPSADDAALERALRASRQLEDAPESLIQRAIDLWQPDALPRPAATPVGGLRRLVATLVFDSAAQPATALGVRSTRSAVRQMLFAVEGRDIDLRFEPVAGGRWRVKGQVLGPDTAGIAELSGDGLAGATVAWNELAEFSFDPIEVDRCTLVLRADGWQVEVQALRPGLDA